MSSAREVTMKRRSYFAIDVTEAVICSVCLLHWSRFQRVSGYVQSARQKTHMALLRDSSTAWMSSRRQLLPSRKPSLAVKLLPKRSVLPPTMLRTPHQQLALLIVLSIMRATMTLHTSQCLFFVCTTSLPLLDSPLDTLHAPKAVQNKFVSFGNDCFAI